MSVTIRLPFATPSQNTYGHWHHLRQARFRERCTDVIHKRLLEMGDPLVRWPTKLDRKTAKLLKGRCRVDGCPQPSVQTDERRLEWCLLHLQTRLQPARRQVVIRRFSAGELDEGNLIGGCKAVVDALVHVGVLYDDRPAWLVAAYEQHKAGRGEGCSELVISEAA
jgi:hypothetical protein